MNSVKKQHFVPRFYLNNFANKQGKFYAFDTKIGKSFGTSVEDVAHRKFFHDYNNSDNDQTIEKALAKFEGQSAQVFKKIISYLESGEISKLSNKDRKVLAEYMIIQQKRTLENRVLGKHFASELERQLRAKGGSGAIELDELDASTFDAKTHQLYDLLSPLLETEVLEISDRTWIFWDNETDINFCTSDHPVVGYNHVEIGPQAYELFFPINSRFGLSILSKKEFPEWVRKDVTVEKIVDEEIIVFYNSLISVNCNRQVYCSEDNFQFAK